MGDFTLAAVVRQSLDHNCLGDFRCNCKYISAEIVLNSGFNFRSFACRLFDFWQRFRLLDRHSSNLLLGLLDILQQIYNKRLCVAAMKRWGDLERLLGVRRVHPLEHRLDIVDLVEDITCALSGGLALDVWVTLLLGIIEWLSRIIIVVDLSVTRRQLRLQAWGMKRWQTLIMRLAQRLTA